MGCNAANHSPDCNCGWGGDTGHYPTFRLPVIGIETTKFSSFTIPNTTCPICGNKVFYYANSAGSKVWFDELGMPWPKHGCFEQDVLPQDIDSPPRPKPLYKGRPCLINKILVRGDKAYVQAEVFSPVTGKENLYFIAPATLANQLNICFLWESKTLLSLEIFDIEQNKGVRIHIQRIRDRYYLLLLAKIRSDDPQLIDVFKRWRHKVSMKKPPYYYEDDKSIYAEEKMSPKDKISLFLWLSKNSGWDLEDIFYFSGMSEYERVQIGKLKVNPFEKSVEDLGLINLQTFELIKTKISYFRKIVSRFY